LITIGNLKIKKTAALAPMAGVADRAFREICAGFGACYVVAEMASAKAMSLKSEKTAGLLAVSDIERPAAIQLFGDEPETVATAAAMALKYKPDAIDLNMGCPAPKIAGGGSGAALMKNLGLAGEIIGAAASAVDLPVTVKLRKGWDDENANAAEAARIAEARGAAAVTVHGRTRRQFYAPPVDHGVIRAVKNAVSIPVIGNGDVTNAETAAKMYESTGCDLVMVGRGALGAPWVFREIEAYLTRGEILPPPELDERMAVMLKHIKLACGYKGERVAMREARKHVAWYLKGMKGAAELRRRACALEYYEELEELVKSIL
jgi:nifR3 family TIM-barrel protein